MGGFGKNSSIASFGGRWGDPDEEEAAHAPFSTMKSENSGSSKSSDSVLGKRSASAYDSWASRAANKSFKLKVSAPKPSASKPIELDDDSDEFETPPQSPVKQSPLKDTGNNVLNKAEGSLKGKGKANDEEPPSTTLEADEDADLWEALELPPPPRPDGEPVLSSEQQRVLDQIVEKGKALMFTGGAGTGKSVLLRAVVKKLREKYHASSIGICAMTGIAALHVGGQTLHSWAGIGLGNRSAPELEKQVRNSVGARNRWQQCRVLLVDEVSMLDAVLFDKLDFIAKKLRQSPSPFGGIQLVMVGDFYQLPPVVTQPQFWGEADKQREAKQAYNALVKTYKSRFVFDARMWRACIPRTIVLKRVFRQADPRFVRMLEETRRNCLSMETIREYERLSRPLDTSDGILPTELFPTRAQVSDANESRLRALPGPLNVYKSTDVSHVHKNGAQRGSYGFKSVEEQIRQYLDRHMMVTDKIELKEGAQVMLVKNLTNGLVNGSRGKIIGFMKVDGKAKVVKDEFGNAHINGPAPPGIDTKDDFAKSVGASRAAAMAAKTEEGIVKGEPGLTADSGFETERGVKSEFLVKPEPNAEAGIGVKAENGVKAEPMVKAEHRANADSIGAAGTAFEAETTQMKAKSEAVSKSDPESADGGMLWTGEQEQDVKPFASKTGNAAEVSAQPPPVLRPPDMPLEEADRNRARAQALADAGGDSCEGIEVGIAAGKKRNSPYGGHIGREGIEHAKPGVEYPIVQFVNGQKVLIAPVRFDVENAVGEVEAYRTQVPLILAWSMSIHKAQGQTLDKVKVNLARTFENGQAYVALSRATHLGGIQVLGFHPRAVRMDPNVMEWEKTVGIAEPRIWAEIEADEEAARMANATKSEKNSVRTERKAARRKNKAEKEEERMMETGLSELNKMMQGGS